MKCKKCGSIEIIQYGTAPAMATRIFTEEGETYCSDWGQPDSNLFMPTSTKCLNCGAENFKVIDCPIYIGTMIPCAIVFDTMKILLEAQQHIENVEMNKKIDNIFNVLGKYSGITDKNMPYTGVKDAD